MLEQNSTLQPDLQAAMPRLPRLSADWLEAFMGLTPADNVSRIPHTRHVQSEFNGLVLKNAWQASQDLASWCPQWPELLFTGWLKPLVQATEEAVANERDPDPVAADNLRIESAYAARIKRLVTYITSEVDASSEEVARDDNTVNRRQRKLIIDRRQCDRLCETPGGQTWLLSQLAIFQGLEWRYHSQGQTRLRAMKKLLRSLIQVITGEVLSDLRRHPYRKLSAEGTRLQPDEDYIKDCEDRLIALLAHDAFDVRRFALESPNARLGACAWETVPGSEVLSARLRHYLRPDGVKPNGKTLYMASPMINRCEIFDLAPGKSVVEGMLALGYDVYMIDYGNPGPEQAHLGLSFYAKTLHDKYLDLIKQRHPEQLIDVMAYCMGGSLFLPYLARRIEEAEHGAEPVHIRQVVLMTTPVFFDDEKSGHGPMREVIREGYDPVLMQRFYGASNLPPQAIEAGMHIIQPGVEFNVLEGFYARANFPGAIDDAAPFLHWLNSGTRFPVKAHREWLEHFFLENRLWEGRFCLPSHLPSLDGQPVDMAALERADIALFDYRGLRDPIAPVGSCLASERWGRKAENQQMTRGGLNRTIEKNVGHIFVVSKVLLSEFLQAVEDFLKDEPPAYQHKEKAPAKPAAVAKKASPRQARRSTPAARKTSAPTSTADKKAPRKAPVKKPAGDDNQG